jgi:2-polyprenyl-3-methyl-5-hydroxy-6-metoxy-1,4-benzoquinol methylase
MPNCPICNSNGNKIYLDFNSYFYRRCINCDLVYLDSEAFPNENVSYAYEYIQQRGHDLLNSSIARSKGATASYYLSFLERYADKEALLEIGCSTGITLKIAQKRGWNIYGVEINEAAAAIAQNLVGTNPIIVGNVDEKILPDNFFSAIILFDVLEHINDPMKFIKTLERKLKRGGLILLITPNIDSLSGKLLGEKWTHLFLEHLCLYSLKSIRNLFEFNSFKILKIGWALKFITIDIVRRHLKCHPDILLSRTMLNFLKNISLFNNLIFPFNMGEMYVLARKQV